MEIRGYSSPLCTEVESSTQVSAFNGTLCHDIKGVESIKIAACNLASCTCLAFTAPDCAGAPYGFLVQNAGGKSPGDCVSASQTPSTELLVSFKCTGALR
jgi:hypothetical protein